MPDDTPTVADLARCAAVAAVRTEAQVSALTHTLLEVLQLEPDAQRAMLLRFNERRVLAMREGLAEIARSDEQLATFLAFHVQYPVSDREAGSWGDGAPDPQDDAPPPPSGPPPPE